MSAPELKIVPMDGNIPELERNRRRAKRIEDSWREHAFLSACDEINGVTVNQMTLGHMLILFRIKSPFLTGEKPEPEHVGQFLWILSPQHHNEPGWEVDRAGYVSELVKQYPPERFRLFYRAIHRYIWVRCLMDWPAKSTKSGRGVSASMPAIICHRIASAYGVGASGFKWVIDTPIAALLQTLNCIESDGPSQKPAFHPLQDLITQRYIRTHLNNG
jgi:hypothetical protein